MKKTTRNPYRPESPPFQNLKVALESDSPEAVLVAVRHDDLENALANLQWATSEEGNFTEAQKAIAEVLETYSRRDEPLGYFDED